MSTDDSLAEREAEIVRLMGEDKALRGLTQQWFNESCRYRYSYHFTWLGRPIIQYPQDIVAIQEIIWRTRPEVVIETGVAHGGSLMLSASILELLGGDRIAVGIDIEIRAHNRAAIETHPLAKRIHLIEGSSTSGAVVAQAGSLARGKRTLVILDSHHTHEHVLKELELYSPLVKNGSYVVVFDTVIETMPEGAFPDRPWCRGNNPRTAVWEFLKRNDRFEVDRALEDKFLITVAPGGYLKCIKD
ncbi:MAG: cephalosporin hydroxylase [Cyanobacteria bacterium 13_1_40CM_2_61_4]|nr:MAG: cephalosporin hydroxylase [Cyanobacteria bacterium 13_1_40CM_2_61_4]